jgi:hypothetical protein
MFFRRFFRFVLVVVLLFGIFGIVRSDAYRSGWSQGYVSGQAADGQPAESIPAAPQHQGGGFISGIFGLFWWVITAFFKFWLFVFFIGLLLRFIFGGRRRGHHHHHHGRPFGHWKGGQGGNWAGWKHHDWKSKAEKGWDWKGQRPPWFDDSDGEPVMKA